MTSKFQELLTNLESLGLTKMVAYLPEYVDQINQQQLSFTEAMLTLTSTELEWNQEQSIERIVKRAHFPQKKTLKGFDFNF